MIKMREELRKLKNQRLKSKTRNINERDFDDMEVEHVKRSDCSRRMDKGVLRSDKVPIRLLQDKSMKIQVNAQFVSLEQQLFQKRLSLIVQAHLNAQSQNFSHHGLLDIEHASLRLAQDAHQLRCDAGIVLAGDIYQNRLHCKDQ